MTYKITEYFSDTKESIERDATKEELAAFKTREAKYKALDLAKEEKALAKAALLEKLGITEDEAKLLLG